MSLFKSLLGALTRGAHRISVAEGRERVAEGAVVVDVRSPREFDSGHLPEALNIPVDEIASRLSEIPTDTGVVVYCRSGGRSARVASLLESAGYTVGDLGPMPDLTEWQA